MDWLLFIIALPFIMQVILIIMTIVFCVWLIKHPRRGTFSNNEWNSEGYSSNCYNYDDWVTGDTWQQSNNSYNDIYDSSSNCSYDTCDTCGSGYYGDYEQYL